MFAANALLALALVSQPSDTVLLDFYSTNCPPCRLMDPVVGRLAANGYRVQKIDVQRYPQLAAQYRVTSWPCFVLVSGGREVGRIEGATSYDRLRLMFAEAGATNPNVVAAAGSPISPANGSSIPPRSSDSDPFLHRNQSPPDNGLALGSAPSASRAGGGNSLTATGGRAPVSRMPVSPAPASTVVSAQRPHASAASDAMAASVRLKVEDATGHDYGSGTIIDTHGSEALVLTCAHIFRSSKGQGRIHVDLFDENGKNRTIPGKLVAYDMQRDVGLVAIRPGRGATAVQVADRSYRPIHGSRIFTIGCDRGGRPSLREARISSVTQRPLQNIWVTDVPVDGRSGGGLFTSDGRLIGVCNAADHRDKKGLYAGLRTVQETLDTSKLSFVYNRRSAVDAVAKGGALTPRSPDAGQTPQPLRSRLSTAARGIPSPATTSQWSSQEQAVLDAVRQGVPPRLAFLIDRRQAGQQPQQVVLDRLNPAFLDELAQQLQQKSTVGDTAQRDAPITVRGQGQ